ncbi:hypothetical protein GPECTOR_56g407 [Gonium pectorale]|uniref:EF-hand domain-containing protein n=1 Tax=Gonium pectorale TaxID=33097 RepID=A0A150G7J2_GONPE|nr:hypothetical protein GPECTOR_56g407 [Gonium pectorale]|eukprot:KXZ45310.1 hypothetical protein GPECTOR_56g407 [Gonium pectorale]
MSRTLSVKEVIKQIGNGKRDQKLMEILEELDRDGSGQIDVTELVGLLEGVARGRKERKYMIFAIVAMFVFGIVLIGTIIGLTYAMLYSLKDTEVKGGVMFVKNSDGTSMDIVRTGSAEFSVHNGAMVQRLTPDSTKNTTNVLQTADYMGTPQSLNSEIDIGDLLELKYLLINGTGKAQLGLMVQGVARIPLEGSIHGTVLHIITAAGTVTLDGTVITFSTVIANIFAEAGFRVSSTRRALLGSYAVLGFFNTIKDLSASGKPASMSEPKLPSANFIMKLKIYEPCVIPDLPNDDRCIYVPPQSPPSTSDPAPPPSSAAASPPPNGTRRLAIESTSGAPRRKLRHRWVATAPHLQTSRSRRSRTETTYAFNGKARVVYDFPIYPFWQKIEVMSGKTVYSWQQNVLPEDSTNPVMTYFCSNYSSSTTGAAGFNASSVLNYTYTGIDTVGDKLARHFEMYVVQPSSQNNLTGVMHIDYWDSLDTNTPLRFEFTHRDIGTVMMDVLEFVSIDSTSPEAAPALYQMPANNGSCPNYPSVPRLSSAFMVRGSVVAIDMPAVDEETSRRRIAETAVLAQVWERLDHVNGTGNWPQWALDMYGGVHPARRMEAAVRRALGSECGVKTSFSIPVAACSIDVAWYTTGSWALAVGCGGNVGPVTLAGSLELDTCESKVKGCVAVGVGLSKENWLVKKIGINVSIDIASACVGYNYKDHYFFIEASLILNLLIFKAELSFEMDFSSCCIWIASVTLEASVGLTFINVWVVVGSIDIVSNVYLRGSAAVKEETDNPTPTNQVGGWTSVGDGYWGDWKDASFPCTQSYYDAASSSLKTVGLPINSFLLRVESDSAADDTALNGISVGCMTGTANSIEDGSGFWGDWTSTVSCSSGGYFVGARMRIESPGGDDTAANSVVFTCSNARGSDLSAHYGFWGDWTGWTYCPGNTYICGLQVRVEDPVSASDDTAMNGMRIACCSFPVDNATSVISTTELRTGTNSLKSCLDITNNVHADGTYLQQLTCSNSTGQYFTLTSTLTGAYTITTINDATPLCVAVKDSGTSSGTRVALAACSSGATNQAWSVTPYDSGTYTLSPTNAAGMCLDINGASASDKAQVQLWTCNRTPAQVFTLDLPTRSTTQVIKTSTTDDRCLAVTGTTAGSYIQQWECDESTGQSFQITSAGTNAYTIKSMSGFCVSAKGSGTGSGTRITIEACVSGAMNQLWSITSGYNGGISVKPMHTTGMCLDVAGATTSR